jgi:sulfate/thiosulfate transport system ATP-binding protein
MSIAVYNVNKRFGAFTALENINLQVKSGELLALLGPSGSGKTTLLRILAGLEQPDGGSVQLEGVDVTGDPVRERRVGFVFQHYALFRHLTIFENIAFGLRVLPKGQRPAEAEIKRRVHELLDLIQLSWVAQRFPHELSGGQRQRVALARALAVQPKVLLLDEPFGALDAKVRQELRGWLRRLHDEIHITSVFVTHDQEEALEVSDRVVILDKGKIAQVGSPVDVYHDADNPFVYEFLGPANRFQGAALHRLLEVADHVQAPAGVLAHSADLGFVRPHDFCVVPANELALTARLADIRPLGQQVWLSLHVEGQEDVVRVQLPWREWQALDVAAGAELNLRPRHVQVFRDAPVQAAWQGEGSDI